MASFESYPDPKEKAQTERNKKRLKTILAVAVVALVAVAVIVGVAVWRNSALSTAHQTDTEALTQSSAGVNDTTFSAVTLPGLPPCTKMYGKTLKQLKAIPASQLSFDSKLKKSKDVGGAALSEVVAKKVKYTATAQLKSTDGAKLRVFFDKNKKSIAAYYEFDLDALGVADAEFSVLAADRKVASSLLLGVGLSKSVASKKVLSLDENAPSIGSNGNEKTCTFTGNTGESYKKVVKKKKVYDKKKHKKVVKKVKKKVQVEYMSWQLDETYSYASGGGATTRTAKITLF